MEKKKKLAKLVLTDTVDLYLPQGLYFITV